MAYGQRDMRYWVFHEEMLAKALAEREAARIGLGISGEQAQAETYLITEFLTSPAAKLLTGGRAG